MRGWFWPGRRMAAMSEPQDVAEDCRSAYRAMHEQAVGAQPAAGDRALSVARYDAARREYLQQHGEASRAGVAVWPPTSQTLMKQLGDGSWAQAMASLGLEVAQGRARGAGRFDDAAYRATVRNFLDAVAVAGSGASASFAAFTAWLAEQKAAGQVHPSAAAVRKHFGSWEEAKTAAQPTTMP